MLSSSKIDVTDSLKLTIVSSTIGVRQDSPTSGALFTFFVNHMISLIKSTCGTDGFLSWLHLLVLMDDTVIMSTTRAGLKRKLALLDEFCSNNGIQVNNTKTIFIAIHSSVDERAPVRVGGMVVGWCDKYTYSTWRVGCFMNIE